jgi:hypothetical protein
MPYPRDYNVIAINLIENQVRIGCGDKHSVWPFIAHDAKFGEVRQRLHQHFDSLKGGFSGFRTFTRQITVYGIKLSECALTIA